MPAGSRPCTSRTSRPPASAPTRTAGPIVGHGVLDWGALVPALKQIGVKLYVAEHDKPNDVARFARAGDRPPSRRGAEETDP